MKKVFIIVDIDGTICDSYNRVIEICNKFWVNTSGKNFDSLYKSKIFPDKMLDAAFKEKLLNDNIIPGATKIFIFAEKNEANLIFLTGRGEQFREVTTKWLCEKFGLESVSLFMRGEEWEGKNMEDYKEHIFINEIYNNHKNSFFVFFDNNSNVLDRFSKYGVTFKAPDCWDTL